MRKNIISRKKLETGAKQQYTKKLEKQQDSEIVGYKNLQNSPGKQNRTYTMK